MFSIFPVFNVVKCIESYVKRSKVTHGNNQSYHFQQHRHGKTLQWRHNERDGSNRQPHDCLLNGLFGSRSKKTSNLCIAGLCEGNSPVTGKFPTQRASNAENASIWWRHHENIILLNSFCKYLVSHCNDAPFSIISSSGVVPGSAAADNGWKWCVRSGRVASLMGLVWVSPTTCGDGAIQRGNGRHLTGLGTVIGGKSSWKIGLISETQPTLDLYSLSGRTYYRQISWSL